MDENSANTESGLGLDDIIPSGKLLANYGILFMLWGGAGVLKFGLDYIDKYAYISIFMRQSIRIMGYLVIILWLVGTIYFLYKHGKSKLTYFGLVLRFVWGSMALAMVLINVIQMNVLKDLDLELQHPIFMVLYAMAATISGALLRQKMLILGGIIFAICALLSSYLDLKDQLVLEAVGWFVAFIIPGYLMYRLKEETNKAT